MPAKRQHISPGQPERTKTGFSELDEITGGFAPGELIIVASRPSMGRTSLLFNLATHIALVENKGVALVTPGKDVFPRLLAFHARFNWAKLLCGEATSEDWQSLRRAGQALGEANITTCDYKHFDLGYFIFCIERHCENRRCVIIDNFENIMLPHRRPWKNEKCLQLKDAVRNMPTPMIISLPLWIEDHSP
ncbi:MAG: hypothetical protein DRP83_09985, partial [Planctomycetota bacterium]